MIETATGLVIRVRPFAETSLIVHWLTSNLGRVATMAKGARRPKSPMRGKLDLFYFADFSFSRSQRSDLHNLREVSLRETHRGLRQDIVRLQQISYCSALVEQATETDTPLPGVFGLLAGLLEHLLAHGTQPQTVFAFELKLLDELGLKPDVEASRLHPGTKQMVKALTENSWPLLARLRQSEAQIEELNQFLHGFLIYHLGRIPKGRSTALDRHS
jgi:DNA repair protein RecO (recombination protein O)